MPIDTDPLAGSHPAATAERNALAALATAAKTGIEGAGQIFTTGSPFTINAATFGDAMDFWLPWNAGTDAAVTLATGVEFGKTFHGTRLGAGNVNIAATNVVSGAASTTALHGSIVLRSLGNDTWVRIQ